MDWPSDEQLLEVWRRLTADPTVLGLFADLTLEPLVAALIRQFPKTDPDDVFSAATDALMWFGLHPERYDLARAPLPAFLLLIARRRLLNILAKDKKHREKKIPWDSVELDLAERNKEEEDDPLSFDAPELQIVIAAFTETERRVFDLMTAGERSTAAFAAALGLADRPAAEQEAEVKRAKDRIKARLKRAAGGSHE